MRSPALSFSNNKAFRSLIRRLVVAENVTLLCGAGISMGAGLPSWAGLIDQVAAREADRGDALAQVARQAESDLMRLAALLLPRSGTGTPRYGAVSSALYGGSAVATPSGLADSIAHLATALPSRLGIVTTNFDDVLEQALDTYFRTVTPLSLKDKAAWWEAFQNPNAKHFHVLHLHGFLGRSSNRPSVLEPLVLTEDEFQFYGRRVQDQVRKIVDRSDLVLCVGLSLSDPNLLGGLMRAKTCNNVYVTSVPRWLPNSSQEESLEFTELLESYLATEFGVNPLRLGSHSQVRQVMVELETAVSQPNRYLSSRPKSSSRYGFRLKRCLDKAYSSVGYANPSAPARGDLRRAQRTLAEHLPALRRKLLKLVLASNQRQLRQLASALALQPDSDTLQQHFAREGFGLFLWLPPPFEVNDRSSTSTHLLQLVASSAYHHEEQWSFHRGTVISAYENATHARAGFLGQPVVESSDLQYQPRLWRTNVAAPLELIDSKSQSSVYAGVVVLSSNWPLDEANTADRSILGFLSVTSQAKLCGWLSKRISAQLSL